MLKASARLFEWMASFTRPPRAAWSVEECARFAALREYELLQLLSRDKKALTTARRLGLSLSHPSAAATAQQVNRPLLVVGLRCRTHRLLLQRCCPVGQMLVSDAVQRAAHSAMRHGEPKCAAAQCVGYLSIFIVRLRRFVSGTLGFPSTDCTATSCFALSAKRGSGERPSLGCSSSSEASSAASHQPVQHRRG